MIFRYQIKFINKDFLKNFYLFIILKAIGCFFVFSFLSIYDSRIFSFTDLEFYNRSNINIYSANYIFSLFVKLLGYSPENVLSIKFLSLSFLISSIFTAPYLYLSTKYHNYKSTFFYIILLSFHPYLSLYSLKLDTSIFGLFAISFFSLYVFEASSNTFSISLLITSISTLFRNALLPFSLSYIGIYLFFKKRDWNLINNLIIWFSFFVIGFVLFSQIGYGLDYVQQNYGCYSFSNIKIYLESFLGYDISSPLAYIITPIVHLALDLGAREAISIYCINLPVNLASSNTLNIISTFVFFIFHFLVFCKFIFEICKKITYRKIQLFLPLTILLPTLYGTAHMRYLIPLIPLLMFFLFENQISDERYNVTKKLLILSQ